MKYVFCDAAGVSPKIYGEERSGWTI